MPWADRDEVNNMVMTEFFPISACKGITWLLERMEAIAETRKSRLRPR